MAQATLRAEVDAIWRGVVLRARCEPAWQVAALGLALPTLRGIVRRVVAVSAADADDASSEVVAAFLEELRWVSVQDSPVDGVTGTIEGGTTPGSTVTVTSDHQAVFEGTVTGDTVNLIPATKGVGCRDCKVSGRVVTITAGTGADSGAATQTPSGRTLT